MKKTLHLTLVAGIAALAFVSGCASRGEMQQSESGNSAEQTDTQKRARIRMQLAVGYFEQGQMKIALDEVRQALQLDPDFADAHSVRGLIYMNLGEPRLAEESLLRAIRLAPANADMTNNYGWFLCQNGREKESIGYFESSLKSKSYQSPSKALHNAGVCSLKMKDEAAAERYFLQAFQVDPGNMSTCTNLAKIYYDRRDYVRSRFYIGLAVKADVLTSEVLWLAIRTERKMGDRAAETSLVTQLSRRHPGSREYAAYLRGAFDE